MVSPGCIIKRGMGDGMEGVERLSLVSKVLFDSRLCELKRENEELRMKVFWLEHGMEKLAERMQWGNCSQDGPRCTCFECLESGRFHPVYAGPGTDRCMCGCTFKPWFEERVAQCGMSVGREGEADGHFWHGETWQYGRKLSDVRRSDSPELCKLHALFEVLGAHCGFAPPVL